MRESIFRVPEGRQTLPSHARFYCTVSTIVLLEMSVPVVVLVMVAVMFVVPAATLVAKPLPPLPSPVLMVATLVFDELQLTAFVRSWLADPLA